MIKFQSYIDIKKPAGFVIIDEIVLSPAIECTLSECTFDTHWSKNELEMFTIKHLQLKDEKR